MTPPSRREAKNVLLSVFLFKKDVGSEEACLLASEILL